MSGVSLRILEFVVSVEAIMMMEMYARTMRQKYTGNKCAQLLESAIFAGVIMMTEVSVRTMKENTTDKNAAYIMGVCAVYVDIIMTMEMYVLIKQGKCIMVMCVK